MTYRAVQLHNGTISFKSEADRGTTFRLEFPAPAALLRENGTGESAEPAVGSAVNA
jgi:hypothetical protein